MNLTANLRRILNPLSVALFALLLGSDLAAAETVVVPPEWKRRPTAAEIEAEYPKVAWALDVEGRARISCAIARTEELKDCRVVSESPADLGFGAAALRISKVLRISPRIVDGRPTDAGAIGVPMRFSLPAATAHQLMPTPPTDLVRLASEHLSTLSDEVIVESALAKRARELGTQTDVPNQTAADAYEALRAAASDRAPELRAILAVRLAAQVDGAIGSAADPAFADALSAGLDDRAGVADWEKIMTEITAAARADFCRSHAC